MSFQDIVGHSRQLSLLREALRQGNLAPAYLFTGPEGVGKSHLPPMVLGYLVLGVLMGLCIGVFPGLDGIAGLSLLLPFMIFRSPAGFSLSHP